MTSMDTTTRRTMRPGAPAWDGDLSALSDEDLHRRIEALAVHIGNLHTVWAPLDGWRAATGADLAERELPRWVAARLAALGERERRLEAAPR